MLENSKSNNSSFISSSDDDDSNLGVHNKDKNAQIDQMELTYLDIFSRPSYRDSKKENSKMVKVLLLTIKNQKILVKIYQ